jgi:tetratricopeptide (TPR) repeat protein
MAEENDPIMDEANHFFDQEKYEDAIKLFDKLIAKKKFGAEPFYMKAECLQSLNRLEEAVAYYDKSIEIDDENPLIWNGKGNTFYHMDEFAKARVCFECAYDLDPENFDYLYSIIETALLSGDFEDATHLARDALDNAKMLPDIVLAWSFSIMALFLEGKPLNALETLAEMIAYMMNIEWENDPAKQFTGNEFDLCGVEKVMATAMDGATRRIVDAILSYIKGTMTTEQLASIDTAERENIRLEDVHVTPAEKIKSESEQYPDFRTIVDARERDILEKMDTMITKLDENLSFESFQSLFAEYEWGVDRGPAPFIEEISNRFFIDIDGGVIKRLSIDLDMLAAAGIDAGARASPGNPDFDRTGAMLQFHQLEAIFITAENLDSIIRAMRAASFGEGREITLYVNVEKKPDIQADLLALGRVPEISEIDEIPVDYQEEGLRVVGSMKWTASR